MEKQRYIDPMTPWGFMHIFGRESNKDLLIDFLNAMFEGRKIIRDLQYLKLPESIEERDAGASIRVICEEEGGEKFLVDLQIPAKGTSPEQFITTVLETVRMPSFVPDGEDAGNREAKDN